MADDDNITTAEQIISDHAAGRLTDAQAQLQLLAEIANAVWYLVADVDELLDMARDAGDAPARVH